MVDYTTFIQLGHEVYKEKGGTYNQGTAVDLVETLGLFWSRNKEELKTIGRREAKRLIEENMNV